MIGYAKYFENNNNNNNNKKMSFKVIDKRLLKKYTKIWGKISSLMNKESDSELVYGDNDKHTKIIIKSNRDKINPNFQGKKSNRKYIIQIFVIDNVRFCC